jgi:serine/threonine protein kinase
VAQPRGPGNEHFSVAPGADRGPAAPGDDGSTLAGEVDPELQLVRRLGVGSAAEVFLARDPQLKRLVAVKVLSKDLADDRVARARFEREAAAAAALDHPNVVTVHRFGYTHDGVPYLVMQYVDGVTLGDRLSAEGPLPVIEARRILADVADALAAAHKSGFVHRDIRPANVLCERESGRVLVTDFGLAGLLPAGQAAGTRITQVGEVLGEPEYLSPEQLRGDTVTEGTDVYALGVMGYEVLTGQSPFRHVPGQASSAAHLRSGPRFLKDLRDDVDPDLAELLMRCLSKGPEKRPNAAYLARVLREGKGHRSDSQGGVGRDFVDDLIRRRLPQVMVITLVAGYAALGFIDQLVDRGVIPGLVYRLSLCTFVYGVVASAVIGWFHGKKGRQRVSSLEVGLVSVLAVAWILTCVFIAMV